MAAADLSALNGRRFNVIAADPAWKFKPRAAPKPDAQGRRDVEVHYDTMTLEEIASMPVRDIADRDCHLFLWTTGPHLPQAFKVMEAWGFRYSATGFVWVKQRRAFNPDQLRFIPGSEKDMALGLGLTTRKNVEICLLGRRGNPKRLARDVRELIIAPVRQHSRKPDEFYSRVERYAQGPRLELFSREARPGWTVWGAQTDKFTAPQP